MYIVFISFSDNILIIVFKLMLIKKIFWTEVQTLSDTSERVDKNIKIQHNNNVIIY